MPLSGKQRSHGGKVRRLSRQFLGYALCVLIAFQPPLLQAAQITAARDVAAENRPTVREAANGVAVVDIVAPNGAGLSHNRYARFDVARTGAILNNSGENLERARLGGLLEGNPHLRASGPARVILNEVTAANRSLLAGPLEVHGGRADVVIANPNGISCTGCGFINTPRVTLSTGRPELARDGALAGLAVAKGTIAIGGNGADLAGVDTFALISRKITVAGPVTGAGALDLVAGRNRYGYRSGAITPLGDDGKAPTVAIDSSLFGGMYAGRIRITATDRGAGVHMSGQMAANAEDMSLTSDGKLVLGAARAKKTLTATSQSAAVRVAGPLFSGRAIALDGKRGITLADDALVASAGAVSLRGERVTLGKAALVASGMNENGRQRPLGALTIAADHLAAGKGQLAAGEALTVTAASIDLARATDDESDVLRSLGGITLNTERVFAGNARVTALGDLNLNSAASLALTGGRYTSGARLSATADAVTTSAVLQSKDTITLRARDGKGVNTGRIVTDKDALVHAQAGLNNAGALLAGASLSLDASGGVTNSAAGRMVGAGGVVLTAAALANAGEITAPGSALTVTSGGALENSGTLSGTSADLRVDGGFSNSGTLNISDALTLTGSTRAYSGALINRTGGTIASGTGKYASAAFANNGSLTSRGGLEIDLVDSLNNAGTIAAKTALTLAVAGDLENSGTLVAENALTLGGRGGVPLGTVSNRGAGALIDGGQDLRITATALDNSGAIGATGGTLALALDGDLDNGGLLYARGAAHYRLDGALTNVNGDILAETDLTITGRDAARAGALRNASGAIEAIAGDLSVAADTLENVREKLVVGHSATTRVAKVGNTTTTIVTTRETLDRSSAPAQLRAGGNLVVTADTLTNSYSEIAAGGAIALHADTVDNRGRDLIETVDNTHVTTRRERYCKGPRVFGKCLDHGHRTVTTRRFDTASSTYDAAYATITAGGKLDARVSGYLNNDAVREGAGQIGLASGGRALAPARVTTVAAPGNRVERAQLDLSINTLLGRRALFTVAPEANAPFLMETRARFIDPGKYLGSDYFLERIGGYHPERTLRRFGDAYVETRLVRDQLFALSGNSTLGEAGDVRALMRALYRNGIDAGRALGLTPGLALAPDQIARLTHDIVWPERHSVRGEAVLVPRVYLAAATAATIDPAGARIAAGQIDLHGATLSNSGTIAARDALTISADRAVFNRGGGLFSQGDLTLAGGKLFANTSGSVTGDNVRIGAQNILSDSAKTRDRRVNGFGDRIQQIGRITARGDLRISAADSIAAEGGRFTSGGDLRLTAGEMLTLGALALEHRAEDTFAGGYNRDSGRRHQLSTMDAGGALTLDSGGDLTLRGVTTTSGGDTTLGGTGDVTIASVQDHRSQDFKLDIKTGGLFGVDTNIREQSVATQTRKTTLTSGGDLTLTTSEKDLALSAARLESEGQTTLAAAQGTVALKSTKDSGYEQKKRREEDALWWNESAAGHHHETIEHVEITAGGGLEIDAGKGIVIEYHRTGDLETSLEQLAAAPGLEWLGTLKNDPRVDWRAVEAQFEQWDYDHQGLTEAGAVLVSLVLTAVSAGALAGLSAALTQGIGLAAHGAAQAALQAGLGALVNQAGIALINNEGNLGAALETLGDSSSLRRLATAMVAAGLTAHLGTAAGVGADLPNTAPLAARVSQDLQRGLVRATVRAGVSTAIAGDALDENLVRALRQEAAAVIGENAAQEIGSAVDAGNLDRASQLIAHAALGCAVGATASGNCASGAAGGVIGESVGLVTKAKLADWLEQRVQDARSGTVTREQLLQELNRYRDAGIDAAGLASGFAVALVGGDVAAAATAGENAAENNAVCGGVCIGIAAVVAGYTTYAGDGNPLEGLAVIGSGDDPLSKAIAGGVGKTVALSAEKYPQQTAAVLGVLEATGDALDATITYVDDATGNIVSTHWNDIPQHTRNQIKGGAGIASIVIPAGSIKALGKLKKTGKLPAGTNRIPVPDDLPKNVHNGQQGKHISGYNSYDAAKNVNIGGKALKQFGRSIDDLSSTANQAINKEGLTTAARALTKHASGQRSSGTFPKLKGNISQQNETAQKIVNDILKNPDSKFTDLSRGGLEVRAPDGRGLRFNSDGKLSGFLDPMK